MSYSIALRLSDLALFSVFSRRLLTIPTWPKIRNIRPPGQTRTSTRPRIAELEDKLARVEVIDVSKFSGDTIRFEATATLVDEDSGEKKVWQIVGEPEADANKGKISVTSPVARALIGKNKGDTVEIEAPGGAKSYKIRKVEWLKNDPLK
jgi:transcription elongation GreA/GreB family factor